MTYIYRIEEGVVSLALALEDGFHDILKKARYGLGLDPNKVAQAAAISTSQIEAFESGSKTPSDRQTEALAKALDLNGWALWAIVQGWGPEASIDLSPYQVQTFRFPKMDSNGYVLTGPGIQTALLVDPGDRADDLIAACRAAGGLGGILLTHTHFDHIEALSDVVRQFPDVPIVVHEKGAANLPDTGNVTLVAQDTLIELAGTQLQIWTAPGHSDDGLLIRLGNLVFTGDTLFAGSLGRSAQGPATYRDLLASARRLLSLPPQTRLLPGHGPVTTVALESTYNPFIA